MLAKSPNPREAELSSGYAFLLGDSLVAKSFKLIYGSHDGLMLSNARNELVVARVYLQRWFMKL